MYILVRALHKLIDVVITLKATSHVLFPTEHFLLSKYTSARPDTSLLSIAMFVFLHILITQVECIMKTFCAVSIFNYM